MDDFYEDSFTLLAVHSSMEDHVLVYTMNQFLKSKLKRSREDLDIAEGKSFPIFEWKDFVHDHYWTLITNQSIREENIDREDLFSNETSSTVHYLVPEYKEVDYFLKIDHDGTNLQDTLVRSITGIPKIVTAYTVDTNKLKSKKNLIF